MLCVVSTRHTNLNVRSGPGTQYRVIRSLRRGVRVEVVRIFGRRRKTGISPIIDEGKGISPLFIIFTGMVQSKAVKQ